MSNKCDCETLNPLKISLNPLVTMPYLLFYLLLASCTKDKQTVEVEYRVQCGACESAYLNDLNAQVEATVINQYSTFSTYFVDDVAEIIVSRLNDSSTLYTQILKDGQIMASDSAVYPEDEVRINWTIK